MTLLEKAMVFSIKCHHGQKRKLTEKPYILHPMEAALIVSNLTDSEETVCAAFLHDTVEDADISIQTIEEEFGKRVAFLVLSETEEKNVNISPPDSWYIRKEKSLNKLRQIEDREVHILWLGDKLSNLRSIAKTYRQRKDEIWSAFNCKDKKQHKWYYESISKILSDLSDTCEYKEFRKLYEEIFECTD